MTLTSGEEIIDRIESIDHQTKRFQYDRIKSPFQLIVIWNRRRLQHRHGFQRNQLSVEIDVDEDQRDELTGFIKQL